MFASCGSFVLSGETCLKVEPRRDDLPSGTSLTYRRRRYVYKSVIYAKHLVHGRFRRLLKNTFPGIPIKVKWRRDVRLKEPLRTQRMELRTTTRTVPSTRTAGLPLV